MKTHIRAQMISWKKEETGNVSVNGQSKEEKKNEKRMKWCTY